MRLIVIRHGQTACNITDIWHGWDDCSLTDLGIAQAQALAERLRDEPVVAVHCSDLRRAVQTAEIVAAPHGLTPIPDPAFRERHAGDLFGLTTDQVIANHPDLWRERALDYWGWTPPNGENFHTVLARVLAGVERLRMQHPDQTVAVVGHMGTVRVLIAHYLDLPMSKTYEMDFPSSGVSIFRLEGEKIVVEVLNDAGHLPFAVV